jgi:ribosomal protein S18 acetylase RimI-like enzyme
MWRLEGFDRGSGELSYATIVQIERMEPNLRHASSSDGPARFPSIGLQHAGDGDLSEVVSLLNRAYRGSGENAGWTTEAGIIDGDRDNAALLKHELRKSPKLRLMIWRWNGKVEGCVCLESATDKEWSLGSFAVDPRLQNKQVGRRLLAAAEDHVRGLGGRTVKMKVIQSRLSLIAWYERRGYRKTGETVPFPYSETRFGVPREAGLRLAVLSKELAAEI